MIIEANLYQRHEDPEFDEPTAHIKIEVLQDTLQAAYALHQALALLPAAFHSTADAGIDLYGDASITSKLGATIFGAISLNVSHSAIRIHFVVADDDLNESITLISKINLLQYCYEENQQIMTLGPWKIVASRETPQDLTVEVFEDGKEDGPLAECYADANSLEGYNEED